MKTLDKLQVGENFWFLRDFRVNNQYRLYKCITKRIDKGSNTLYLYSYNDYKEQINVTYRPNRETIYYLDDCYEGTTPCVTTNLNVIKDWCSKQEFDVTNILDEIYQYENSRT